MYNVHNMLYLRLQLIIAKAWICLSLVITVTFDDEKSPEPEIQAKSLWFTALAPGLHTWYVSQAHIICKP